MKLPGFIKNVYVSGFPREGLVSAFVDDIQERDYKQFSSSSHVFTNALVRIRLELTKPSDSVRVSGKFGSYELRVRESEAPSENSIPKQALEISETGLPENFEGFNYWFTARLCRGKNFFDIEVDGQKWQLLIHHKTQFRDWVEGFAKAVILIVGLNTFVIQGSYIPSASMMNTLVEGDFIWVNKSAFFFEQPARGDVVVFNFPLNPARDFIKRLVGLPGDRIRIDQGQLYINDQKVQENWILRDFKKEEIYAQDFTDPKTGKGVIPEGVSMVRWDNHAQTLSQSPHLIARNPWAQQGETVQIKDLKDGKEIYPLEILAVSGVSVEMKEGGVQIGGKFFESASFRFLKWSFAHEDGPNMNMAEITVPHGKYFVLGDNRDNSQDSRFWGFVDHANLKGRALFLYYPLERMRMILRKTSESHSHSSPQAG